MSVYIENELETKINLDFDYEELINRVINFAVDYVNCPYETEVNVVLTDNYGIQEINKNYRNIDAPTDVLSFPMLEYPEPADFTQLEEDDTLCDAFNPETGELLLGDIMISLEKVTSQAEEFGHSKMRELGFLVAHSMLHLFGYDHMEEAERKIMEDKQRDIMDKLQIFR